MFGLYTQTGELISGKKRKKIYPCGGQVVFGWGTSIVSWIECVVPIFTNLFEIKSFIKMAFFQISYRHLYWNIPGVSWQGRTRRFPFQTGLSCPSNHQGSLRKYIPSVEAWGEREWMEVSRGRSEEEVFKATGGLLPRGFSGRRAFSSDPRQPSPEQK